MEFTVVNKRRILETIMIYKALNAKRLWYLLGIFIVASFTHLVYRYLIHIQTHFIVYFYICTFDFKWWVGR